jgi:hypothetical protein
MKQWLEFYLKNSKKMSSGFEIPEVYAILEAVQLRYIPSIT